MTQKFSGSIIGRWATDKVLVRLTAGATYELPAPEEIQAIFDIGDEVVVYIDGALVVGWELVNANLGVDMRGSNCAGRARLELG